MPSASSNRRLAQMGLTQSTDTNRSQASGERTRLGRETTRPRQQYATERYTGRQGVSRSDTAAGTMIHRSARYGQQGGRHNSRSWALPHQGSTTAGPPLCTEDNAVGGRTCSETCAYAVHPHYSQEPPGTQHRQHMGDRKEGHAKQRATWRNTCILGRTTEVENLAARTQLTRSGWERDNYVCPKGSVSGR